MSNKNLQRTLVEGGVSLRYSQPASLNDPYEGKMDIDHAVNLMEEILRNRFNIPDTEESKKFFSIEKAKAKVDATQKVDGIYNRRYGLISLCIDPLSTLMWSHYGNEHKGFCIEFNNKKDCLDGKIKNHIYGVRYSTEIPKLTEKTTSEHVINTIITKDYHWAYEKERRAIADLENLEVPSKLDDFNLPIYTDVININSISRIILGVNSSDSDLNFVSNWINENNAAHVKIAKIIASSTIYELQFIDID